MRTFESGQFRLTNLPDGVFDVAFTLSGFVTETRRVVIVAGSYVDLGSVILRLDPGNSTNPTPFSDPFLTDRYIPVLNRLFQYSADQVLPEVLLRFTIDCDCDVLEMQIVPDKQTNGAHAAYRFAVWYRPRGSTSIYDRLQILTNYLRVFSVEDAASRIPVSQAAMTAAAGTLLADLFDGVTTLSSGRNGGAFDSGCIMN